jgi:NAD kinase
VSAPKKEPHPVKIAQVIVVFSDGSTLLLNKSREQAAMSDLFGVSTGSMGKLENELITEQRRRKNK